MKIYISGRITRNPHYIQDFQKAEEQLKLSGFEVVNPTKVVPLDENKTWRDYMKDDIKTLVDCEAIYMLAGWWRSRGARLEHHIANKLKMAVYYE